jgi:hypothetical protein
VISDLIAEIETPSPDSIPGRSALCGAGEADLGLQIILNEAYEAIDAWSNDYILANERYAKKTVY